MTVTPEPNNDRLVDQSEFAATFGESLSRTLDLRTWRLGDDLAELYTILEAEVVAAMTQESETAVTIRQKVLPLIAGRPLAPEASGVYRVTPDEIAEVHRSILFNGGVEAAEGVTASHDTLAVTIAQIGVSLVRYFGEGGGGTWVHRLFWRDLRTTIGDPVEDAIALIQQRQRASNFARGDRQTRLSLLARRAIQAYAERAILLDRSDAPWRLGHGNPIPLELLSGAGSMELLDAGLKLVTRLIGGHRKFVYVPRSGGAHDERGLLTIGYALAPLEYVVIDDMTERLRYITGRHTYDATHLRLVETFVETIGPQLLIGIYRVTRTGPPHIFYAHRDHVHEAALIVLADSALQEQRAFPLLLDLADTLSRTTFGPTDFNQSVKLAYLEARQSTPDQTDRHPGIDP